MKFLLLMLCAIWFGALSQGQLCAQSATNPTQPEYTLTGIGVYGGADYRNFRVNAPSLGFPACCTQNFGSVTTLNWLAGLSFDHTLTNWLTVDVRAHIFSSSPQFNQQEQVLVGVQGIGRQIVINHEMNLRLLQLGVEPSLKMRILPVPITTTFAPSVFLQLGINAAFDMGSTVQYSEQLPPDSPVRFLDANNVSGTVRNQYWDYIPNLRTLQLSAFAGLESEIYLERKFPANWILAPYARYYFPLTGVTASDELSWNQGLQAGLAVRYRFISPKN